MNLPNALTVGRIAVSPFIAVLPFSSSWGTRLGAFLLFLAAAIGLFVRKLSMAGPSGCFVRCSSRSAWKQSSSTLLTKTL